MLLGIGYMGDDMINIFKTTTRITQLYGAHKNWKRYQRTKGHEGIDLSVGNPSRDSWDIIIPGGFYNGQIIQDGSYLGKTYGYSIKIWFPANGIIMQFCHLSESSVKLGQTVGHGDIIGIMGNTGDSLAAHVHLNTIPVDENGDYRSIYLDRGKYQDPSLVINETGFWTKKENLEEYYG